MKFIRDFVKRIIYREKCDSATYINYLKQNGCKVGVGVHFYSPMTTVIDDVKMSFISIGNYTKITSGVVILAHDYSPSVCVHTNKNVLLAGGDYTSIGDNCFIGMNSIILSGRKIGNNCIVGAGSVITKDIPDNSVCAGNPAKIIMTIDEYNERRKQKYIKDAARNVKHFKEVHGRVPNTEEMYGFSFLFLDKTEENWRKYFDGYLSIDNDVSDVRDAFFNTDKAFEDYDDFIRFCLGDE